MSLRPPDASPLRAAEQPEAQPELRLAELVCAYSLVCDLALGHPSDEVMCAGLLATGLARGLGRTGDELADIYWTTLLAHAGCTAYAHEQASLFAGDEIVVNAAGSKADFTEPREVLLFLRETGRGRGIADRLRIVVGAVVSGKSFDREMSTANCEIAKTVADRLDLAPAVGQGLLDN
jgi:hypothetical protein